MADTIDEISGGRLILGLGAGWHEPEFDAFGYPFDHRASRFEEAIQIIHGLLRTGHVDFEGTYSQARDCELRPRGPRPEGPPIMIGSTGERMLRLAGRYADQWNSDWRNRPENLIPLIAKVRAGCEAVGRDPATMVLTAGAQIDLPGHSEGRRDIDGLPPVSGTPEELAEHLRAYARLGIAHVQILPEPNTAATIEALAPMLEALDRG
jgi:alkanesulfonate monooxygenase SsuD/methylene tetrahydromethanopterin reductase-like flavin-dependent oxidoreductase (luciferase family)